MGRNIPESRDETSEDGKLDETSGTKHLRNYGTKRPKTENWTKLLGRNVLGRNITDAKRHGAAFLEPANVKMRTFLLAKMNCLYDNSILN